MLLVTLETPLMIELHPSQYLVMIRPCDIVLTKSYIFFIAEKIIGCGVVGVHVYVFVRVYVCVCFSQ